MKTIATIGFSLFILSATAVPLQLVSQRNADFAPSVSGGGNSTMPILGGNGRYVLFASSANNLTLSATNTPFQKPGISLDVFFRDRASNTTVLVSINSAGTGGADLYAVPVALSTNGQFVLFESAADNLVSGDNNAASDVFMRDLVNGITILVSVNTNGVCGNGASSDSAMTPDGRYVVFSSAATDLVAGDTNGIPDIFVRDLLSGTTRLVSVGARATSSANLSVSGTPAITPEGRYVAFYSSATNLVAGQTGGGDIFERDTIAGTTTWVSADARSLYQSVWGATNAISCNLRMSDDGNYIAFETDTNVSATTGIPGPGMVLRYNRGSGLTDLIHTNAYLPAGPAENIQDLGMTPDGRFVAFVANVNDSTGTNTAIYLWDAQTGTNLLISANTNQLAPAANFCDQPVVSSNGQYVAFFSDSPELANGAAGSGPFAYRRDVVTGTTQLINVDTNTASAGDGSMLGLDMSEDGQCVAVESMLGSLVAGDSNRGYDVFLRNITNEFVELISVRQALLPSVTCVGVSTLSTQPISWDGRYVTFASDASGLSPGDRSIAGSDVYLCDLYAGTNQIVSTGILESAASGVSGDAAISGDGRYVAFTSSATNLIGMDTNYSADVFIRDLVAQTTSLVSVDTTGAGEGNHDSYSPTISADGRFVLFLSKASNLAAGTFSGAENIFLRDRLRGTNCALTQTEQSCAAMTPDGHFVAFANTNSSTIYVWDSLQAKTIASQAGSAGVAWVLAISSDGNRVASMVGSNPVSISIWDRMSNSVSVVGSGYITLAQAGLRFSADGRFLTYATRDSSAGINQVYVYDVLTHNNVLVSHDINSATDPGNGPSDGPDISADGRFVIYRSVANNLVAGVTGGVVEEILFDAATGSNTVISSGGYGQAAANNRSLAPMFSGDGHTVVFGTWGSDLVANDFNQASDVVAFAFLYAAISRTGGMTDINWPASASSSYSVQYKDNLFDPAWQTLPGTVTVIGNRGYITDPTSTSQQRFYRVRLDN